MDSPDSKLSIDIKQFVRRLLDNEIFKDIEIVILLKLHWDISSTTYVEILPFIYDILASNPVSFLLLLNYLTINSQATSRVHGLRQEEFRAQLSRTISDLAFRCYYNGESFYLYIYRSTDSSA